MLKEEQEAEEVWLNVIDCDMRTAGVCIDDVGDRVRGLGQRWPTPNSWEKAKENILETINYIE